MDILKIKNADGTWQDIVALVGPKGDKGDQGEPGIQGPQGEPGKDGGSLTKLTLELPMGFFPQEDSKIELTNENKILLKQIIQDPTILNNIAVNTTGMSRILYYPISTDYSGTINSAFQRVALDLGKFGFLNFVKYHEYSPDWICDYRVYKPNVPTATTSTVGAVKPDGTTITITNDGIISSAGGPKGDKGDPGIQGPQGEPGPKGDPGKDGTEFKLLKTKNDPDDGRYLSATWDNINKWAIAENQPWFDNEIVDIATLKINDIVWIPVLAKDDTNKPDRKVYIVAKVIAANEKNCSTKGYGVVDDAGELKDALKTLDSNLKIYVDNAIGNVLKEAF